MKELIFTDNGIISSEGRLTVEQALKIGKMSELKERNIENIVIGVRSEKNSSVLASAFSAGASENGINVFYIGEACLPELLYCSDILDKNCLAVYISSVFEPSFIFYKNGVSLEIDIRKIFDDFSDKKGLIEDFSKLKTLYFLNLRKLCAGLENTKVRINSPSERIRKLCGSVFCNYSGEPDITFHIDEKAEKVTAFTDKDGYISSEKLLAIVLNEKMNLIEERDIIIPVEFSGIAEKIALRKRKNIVRKKHFKLDYFTDKILLIVEILKVIQKSKCNMTELLKEIPDFAELERYLPIESEMAFNYLCKEYNLNKNYKMENRKGLIFTNELGKISIKPVSSGKGVVLLAESYAMETASELCNFYENKLNAFVKSSKNIKKQA